MKKFGPGSWYPNGDVNVYATNENNTRGKSPTTDILNRLFKHSIFLNQKRQIFGKHMFAAEKLYGFGNRRFRILDNAAGKHSLGCFHGG